MTSLGSGKGGTREKGSCCFRLYINFGFPDPTWESAADISRENNLPSAGTRAGGGCPVLLS